MIESTSRKQVKNLIDILFSWSLSQINNWQNDERIHTLAKTSGVNTDKIKRFMPSFLSKLKSSLSDNGISINSNSDMKLSDLPRWEDLSVFLVNEIFNSLNQQNKVFESIDFSSINLNSILGSIIGGNYFTPEEKNEIFAVGWSMISDEDRQALMKAGFNIGMQSQQTKENANESKSSAKSENNRCFDLEPTFLEGFGKDITEKLIAQTKQNVLPNVQAPTISHNSANKKRFIENLIIKFINFYCTNDCNRFSFTSENINNIINYLYDIANDQTALSTIYNLRVVKNFYDKQTDDNFNALVQFLNDNGLNRNEPVPPLGGSQERPI